MELFEYKILGQKCFICIFLFTVITDLLINLKKSSELPKIDIHGKLEP